MDTGGRGHGSKCEFCEKYFTADPRLGERQKCCGRPECRQKYKNRWQKAKYFRDVKYREAAKKRVRLWRWNNGGRGRPGQDPDSGAGPPAAASELARVCTSVTLLEQTVAGLLSHSTGCRAGEELRPLLARCAERGRDVLGLSLSG